MNIALIGYGKMGKAVEEIALQRGHKIILKINSDNKQELTKENLQKADAAIEFTAPQNAVENILRCFEAGVPVACGTTGWLNRIDEVNKLCLEKNGTFLSASNFSVGVNIFFELNQFLAKLMNKQYYDVSIEEIHHTQKKDAPSGTAITLAEQVLQVNSVKKSWVNNISGMEDELVIRSKRKDAVPGTHVVNYTSEVDDIQIIHTAHNRKGFATGAVLAAEFLKNKKGVFSMRDVLEIK